MNNHAMQFALEEAVGRTATAAESAHINDCIRSELLELEQIATVRGNGVLGKCAVVDPLTGKVDRLHTHIPRGWGQVFHGLADQWDEHYTTLRGLRAQQAFINGGGLA